jgi:hypothetical protein
MKNMNSKDPQYVIFSITFNKFMTLQPVDFNRNNANAFAIDGVNVSFGSRKFRSF